MFLLFDLRILRQLLKVRTPARQLGKGKELEVNGERERETYQQMQRRVIMRKKISTAMRMNFPTRAKKDDFFLQTRWPYLSVVQVYLFMGH